MIFTIKSPTPSETQSGTSKPTLKSGVANGNELSFCENIKSRKANLAAKAMPKNNNVSMSEPINDDKNGGNHQLKPRRRLKIEISRNCATRKAEPEAMAILGDAKNIDQITAMAKPNNTTKRAFCAPKCRFVKSVTKNAIG